MAARFEGAFFLRSLLVDSVVAIVLSKCPQRAFDGRLVSDVILAGLI
jgi:hypothetical protein